MADQLEPQDPSEAAASPVPNRRERRGKKTGAPAPHGGKFAVPPRSAPPVPSRQYSTRRRSG
ncbi:MAG: hypothetical protein QOG46_79 [Pseudonocardiales bacterium]|jgi:hypothetical protein|nr:hypothetical protein [Pseudonocardiales bacterium]